MFGRRLRADTPRAERQGRGASTERAWVGPDLCIYIFLFFFYKFSYILVGNSGVVRGERAPTGDPPEEPRASGLRRSKHPTDTRRKARPRATWMLSPGVGGYDFFNRFSNIMVGTSVWVLGEAATHCEPASTAWGPVEWGQQLLVRALSTGSGNFSSSTPAGHLGGKAKLRAFPGRRRPDFRQTRSSTSARLCSELCVRFWPKPASVPVRPGESVGHWCGVYSTDDVAGRTRKCRSEARPCAQSPQDDIVSSDAEVTSKDADKARSGERGVRIDVRQSQSRDIARKRKHYDN